MSDTRVSFYTGRIRLSKLEEKYGKNFTQEIKEKRMPRLVGKPDDSLLELHNRKHGFVVKSSDSEDMLDKSEVYNKGGCVTCIITNDSTGKTVAATSYCSLSDNFSYKKGKQIAYGRALKEYNS